ncbi:MAG: MobB domain-containing protein [Burkholderia sp.]|jgi:molybdopterin-guanine dinucleotide biosynthesis adapter protein
MQPKTVGFIGFSGSGKTTLATAVAAELVRRGHRIAALKNAHHGMDIDRPGKDSWRYREAGAKQVIIRSDCRWAMLAETPEPPSVDELLARFDGADIILVEGFKNEGSFPKIEVRRKAVSEGKPRLSEGRGEVVAVASDWDEEGTGVPRLDINDPSAVADFIEKL